MSDLPPSLAEGLDRMRESARAIQSPAWLPEALHALIVAALLRLCDALEAFFRHLQSGTLPATPAHPRTCPTHRHTQARTRTGFPTADAALRSGRSISVHHAAPDAPTPARITPPVASAPLVPPWPTSVATMPGLRPCHPSPIRRLARSPPLANGVFRPAGRGVHSRPYCSVIVTIGRAAHYLTHERQAWGFAPYPTWSGARLRATGRALAVPGFDGEKSVLVAMTASRAAPTAIRTRFFASLFPL